MGCALDDERNVSILPEEQPDEQADETGQVDPISLLPILPLPLLPPWVSLSLSFFLFLPCHSLSWSGHRDRGIKVGKGSISRGGHP